MKHLLPMLALVTLLGAGCSSAPQSTTNTAAPAPTNSATTQTQNTANAPATYTMAEVAAANSASKCWTVVKGAVYDMTAYIQKHPGGAPTILSMCGKDGTDAYNNQHAGQRKPTMVLDGLSIGTLK